MERLDVLEKGLTRLEGSMGTLTDKMISVAESMSKVSDAVTKLAVVDVKIIDLDKSIGRVADSHRALSNRVDTLNTVHHEKHASVLEKADQSGWRRFGLVATVVLAMFGYLYTDVVTERKGHIAVLQSLSEVKSDVREVDSDIERLILHDAEVDKAFKKANGHRYYINKENKENYKEAFNGFTHKSVDTK